MPSFVFTYPANLTTTTPTMESNGNKARTKVVTTTELLERILLFTTFRATILSCTRVCRIWQKCINYSPAIMTKLFTSTLPHALEHVPFKPRKPYLLLFGFSNIRDHAWDMKRILLANGNFVFLIRERGWEAWAFKDKDDPDDRWVFLEGRVGESGLTIVRSKLEEGGCLVEWRRANGDYVARCFVEDRGHPLSEYLEMWYLCSTYVQ